jgi:CHAT domain-containing protein
LGEARGNEGVFGLRRAFTMAGAQSSVMSLWSVSDESTRELMEALYREMLSVDSTPEALTAAQRKWIEKERAADRYPHPFHWAAFVASGSGPHTSQGNKLKGNGRN